MAIGTITNTLLDPNLDPIQDVRVEAYLTRTPASRISDTTAVIPPEIVVTDEDGVWIIELEQTSNLSPVGAQWVIYERVPAAKGGARFSMVSVIAGTRTLAAATITSFTPPAPDAFYTADQINAIIDDLVTEAVDGIIQPIVDEAVGDALVTVEARLDEVEDDVADLADVDVALDARLDAVESTNTTQGAAITSLDGRLDVVEADYDGIEADLTTVETDLATVETDLDDLASSLTTGLAGKVDITSPRLPPTPVGQPDGKVLKVESDALVYGDDELGTGGGGGGTVTTVNGDPGPDVVLDASDVGAAPSTLTGTVTTLSTTVTTLSTTVTTLSTTVTTLSTNLGVAEGDIDDLINLLADNGKGFVNHGSTATTARPSGFASIEWLGTVEPDNWITGDTWNDPS